MDQVVDVCVFCVKISIYLRAVSLLQRIAHQQAHHKNDRNCFVLVVVLLFSFFFCSPLLHLLLLAMHSESALTLLATKLFRTVWPQQFTYGYSSISIKKTHIKYKSFYPVCLYTPCVKYTIFFLLLSSLILFVPILRMSSVVRVCVWMFVYTERMQTPSSGFFRLNVCICMCILSNCVRSPFWLNGLYT